MQLLLSAKIYSEKGSLVRILGCGFCFLGFYNFSYKHFFRIKLNNHFHSTFRSRYGIKPLFRLRLGKDKGMSFIPYSPELGMALGIHGYDGT
jgi:hypothetical protein